MSKSLEQEREELGAAVRNLGTELGKVYGPPLTRMADALARFLDRHPIPRWLEVAMTPLDWIGRQFGRFMRWLWR